MSAVAWNGAYALRSGLHKCEGLICPCFNLADPVRVLVGRGRAGRTQRVDTALAQGVDTLDLLQDPPVGRVDRGETLPEQTSELRVVGVQPLLELFDLLVALGRRMGLRGSRWSRQFRAHFLLQRVQSLRKAVHAHGQRRVALVYPHVHGLEGGVKVGACLGHASVERLLGVLLRLVRGLGLLTADVVPEFRGMMSHACLLADDAVKAI